MATFKGNFLHFLGNQGQPYHSFLLNIFTFCFLIMIQFVPTKAVADGNFYSFPDRGKVKILNPSHHNNYHNSRLCFEYEPDFAAEVAGKNLVMSLKDLFFLKHK